MKKAVVILSGGMDSPTVLYKAIKSGREVSVITYDYNQRHKKEIDFAIKTCEKLGVEHKIIDMGFMSEIASNSSLTSNMSVPEGHYEEESMKDTVVPNRNMIMLSIAIGYAVNIEADEVWYGAHGGDHAIYPDCRSEFVDAMKEVAKISNWEPVDIIVPYLDADKTSIVTDGLEMGVDFGDTWTCYNGREKACGKCGSCQERLEAFKLNEFIDPIEYE